MLEAAELGPGDRVLEVGAGSGYAAAVISRIVGEVYAIERHELLGEQAQKRFGRLGYDNINLRIGDGSIGWPEVAPFDAILVAAGGPAEPDALKSQLKIGGRLVIPLGGHHEDQQLTKIVRTGDEEFTRENLCTVRFVPLVGAEG
jgi:protein-L-isoaspartate(D-aspartate) O-methyltransferase